MPRNSSPAVSPRWPHVRALKTLCRTLCADPCRATTPKRPTRDGRYRAGAVDLADSLVVDVGDVDRILGTSF
jgi:hypothetical protein